MDQINNEQQGLVSNPQVNQSNQSTPPSPVSTSSSKKPLIIGGIILGFIFFAVGGYVLGMQGKDQQSSTNSMPIPTSSPTSELQPSPSIDAVTQEPIESLPSGWTYKSNGKCAVELGIPPKTEPYYRPYDINRQPSVTGDTGSGRFWDFPRGGIYPSMLSKLPNWDDKNFDIQANAMFVSEQEASGYISSAVSVSCIPNPNGLSNQTMLISLNTGLDEFNKDTRDKGMQADTYTVTSSKETVRWGLPVVDLTVSEYFSNPGGQPYTNTTQYTMLATPNYIYEVKVLGASTDPFTKETAQQIFNNIKFE